MSAGIESKADEKMIYGYLLLILLALAFCCGSRVLRRRWKLGQGDAARSDDP